jgi:hypothetical protein
MNEWTSFLEQIDYIEWKKWMGLKLSSEPNNERTHTPKKMVLILIAAGWIGMTKVSEVENGMNKALAKMILQVP